MDFKERLEAFNKEIVELQKKYQVTLYAANVVLPNSEVAPLVRLGDLAGQEEAYEDKNERGAVVNPQAQPHSSQGGHSNRRKR